MTATKYWLWYHQTVALCPEFWGAGHWLPEEMPMIQMMPVIMSITVFQANFRRRQAHMRLIRAYFGHA